MQYETPTLKPVVKITHINLIETKRYKDMYIRPYEASATFNDLTYISETITRLMTQSSVTKEKIKNTLSNENPAIIMPSSNVIGVAPIVNGWDEVRFKFDLVLEISHAGSNVVIINYVQGYSSYKGISYKNTIDDNMELFINSVISLRKIFNQDGTYIVDIIENNGIVYDETGITQQQHSFNKLKVTRPDDLLSKVSTLREVDENTQFSFNVGTIDEMQVVNKKLTTPLGHLSETISAIVDSTIDYGAVSTDIDIFDTTSGMLSSMTPENIDFFSLLRNLKGYPVKSFTLNDLKLLDPNMPVPNVTISSDAIQGMVTTNDSAETYDASFETRISLLIQNSLSNLLDNSVLTDIGFTIENSSGVPNFTPTFFASLIPDINLMQYVTTLINNFIRDTWAIISNKNQSLIYLDVKCYGSEMTIEISVNNEPSVIYVYPTFADAKYLPIVMNNQYQDVLAENYGEIISTATQAARKVLRENNRQLVDQFYM